MNRRPRILLLASRVPYPPVGGEFQKNYELIEMLGRHFDISYLSQSDIELTSDAHAFLTKNTSYYKTYRVSKGKRLISLMKSLLFLKPAQIGYFHSEEMLKEALRLEESIDLVYCILLRTAEFGLKLKKKRLLDMADLLSVNYSNTSKTSRLFFTRIAYLFESKLLAKYEKKIINEFDSTLLFNKYEVESLNSKKVYHIQHGLNKAILEAKDADISFSNSIVFLGKMDYRPNIDAALWFVNNVMPLMGTEFKFVIVGANPVREIKTLAKKDQRIVVTGYVENFSAILKGGLCVVAPMQSGSGIQNKILEAMALGTVNIVSSLAARPLLGVKIGSEILVEDEPQKIASAIYKIKEIPHKYIVMKESAKNYVVNNYSWSLFESKLLEIIELILNKTRE